MAIDRYGALIFFKLLTSDSNGPRGSFNRNDNIIIIVIIIITVAIRMIPQMIFETGQIRDNRGCFAVREILPRSKNWVPI